MWPDYIVTFFSFDIDFSTLFHSLFIVKERLICGSQRTAYKKWFPASMYDS